MEKPNKICWNIYEVSSIWVQNLNFVLPGSLSTAVPDIGKVRDHCVWKTEKHLGILYIHPGVSQPFLTKIL